MKNWILLLLSFSIYSSIIAQDRPREFQIRAGWGIAGYNTESKLQYDDGTTTIVDKDTSGAVTTHFPIEIRFELTKRFNLGLDMRFGNYLYDDDQDNSGKSNSFSSFGLGLEGVIVSRPKFRFYGGATLSTTKLNINERNTSSNSDNSLETIWRGGGMRLYTGFTWFIADGPLGFNMNLGYDSRNFNLKELYINDSKEDLSNLSGDLLVRGADMHLGLVFRMR